MPVGATIESAVFVVRIQQLRRFRILPKIIVAVRRRFFRIVRTADRVRCNQFCGVGDAPTGKRCSEHDVVAAGLGQQVVTGECVPEFTVLGGAEEGDRLANPPAGDANRCSVELNSEERGRALLQLVGLPEEIANYSGVGFGRGVVCRSGGAIRRLGIDAGRSKTDKHDRESMQCRPGGQCRAERGLHRESPRSGLRRCAESLMCDAGGVVGARLTLA
jgi:hypothetical protein